MFQVRFFLQRPLAVSRLGGQMVSGQMGSPCHHSPKVNEYGLRRNCCGQNKQASSEAHDRHPHRNTQGSPLGLLEMIICPAFCARSRLAWISWGVSPGLIYHSLSVRATLKMCSNFATSSG